jgi:hypothetical protein
LVRLETRKKASIFERKKIERIYSEARWRLTWKADQKGPHLQFKEFLYTSLQQWKKKHEIKTNKHWRV